MMPAGNMLMFFAGCVWPCLLACAAVFNWTIAVSLSSGIAFGWWARDRLGALAATTSPTVEAEVVSNASLASLAGGFAGVYKDPQTEKNWEIKEDACAVIAVRERDEREVRGRFDGSELTLHFTSEKMRKASLRDRQLVWRNGAQPWEKQ